MVPEHSQMVTVVLTITTLGLLFSNWRLVNRIGNTFQLGMYFIIVFSLIVASMGDLYNMFHIEYLYLFSYVALVVLGVMDFHRASVNRRLKGVVVVGEIRKGVRHSCPSSLPK